MTRKKRPERWQPADLDRFREAYLSGATNDELARMFRASSDKVEHYLRAYRESLELPARGTFTPKKHEEEGTQSLDLRVLKRLKASTVSPTVRQLADEFDVSPRRIEESVARLQLEHYLVSIRDGESLVFSLPSSGEHSNHVMEYLNGNRVRFGVVSDSHLCSKYSRLDILNDLYDIFEEKGITHVYHCGNWIDGEARFNKNDLLVFGMDNQIRYFVDHYPYRKGITTYYIAGDDHEGWYTQTSGVDIGAYAEMVAQRAGRQDLVYLGYMEHDVYISRAGVDLAAGGAVPEGPATRIRIQHPGGGTAYATSYAPQKIVESMPGGNKPHILLLGHYHKIEYGIIRNVHTCQVGTTELQTTFMRKRKIAAHLGGMAIECRLGDDGNVLSFTPEVVPYMDGDYDSVWRYGG